MNCHDAQEMLHGYLDGELDLPATLLIEQHVRECPACAQTLAEQKVLQTAMKSDGLYYAAPEGLHERVRSALRRARARAGRRGRRIPFRIGWLAAAACVLGCVGLGFLLAKLELHPSREDRLAQEATASHIRSLQVNRKRLVDIHSTDGHVVKPWLTDRLDFSPTVIDVADQGFPLIGGRLDYLDGRPVAALVYQRRQHVINVFVWPDPAQDDREPRHETRQGFHLIEWSRGGMIFWVVSDLAQSELDHFAQQLR
jgi:anti-sigma factor RsiW